MPTPLRGKSDGTGKISLFVYIPVLFNGGLVPYYMLMTRFLHLKNTIWVLILASLVSAVNVLIMKNFFRTIPNSLIESARIDGSGEIRTFFTIVLPLSTPSLAAIGLFVAIAYWNDWMTCSLYIETPKLHTLQYLLQSLMNNIGYLQSMPRHPDPLNSRLAHCRARVPDGNLRACHRANHPAVSPASKVF
ncbi:MAG: carbohydrate ABC transporter permease [Eisenbergiella sp.]